MPAAAAAAAETENGATSCADVTTPTLYFLLSWPFFFFCLQLLLGHCIPSAIPAGVSELQCAQCPPAMSSLTNTLHSTPSLLQQRGRPQNMIPQRQRTCSTPGDAPHLHTWQLLWKRRFTTWSGRRSARFCFSLAGTLGRTKDDEEDDAGAEEDDDDREDRDDEDEEDEAKEEAAMDDEDDAALSRLEVNGVGRRTSGDDREEKEDDKVDEEEDTVEVAAESRGATQSANGPDDEDEEGWVADNITTTAGELHCQQARTTA